tara:strand:+ start:9087 stop:9944 length:858 start_codon:yes stop_codon:yes gene_type:complete
LARNKERTGAHKQQADPPAPLMQDDNNSGGFSFVVPTEFIELPSEGRYYPGGHPLHGESTLEIKQMTAKEEDLLTSRSLLKKGIALDRLLKSVVVNKQIDTNSLLVGDRNAILIATRVSGYGADYQTKITCPSCGAAQDYAFDLNDTNIYDGTDLTEGEAVSNGDGTFTTTLPRTKIEVTFRLLTGTDEKNLVNQVENARKKRHPENGITRQLKQIILAVNGDDTQKSINYTVENMPSMDARHLRLAYKLATPNVDLTQTFECNECDYDQEMEVPLTADFFWPDR